MTDQIWQMLGAKDKICYNLFYQIFESKDAYINTNLKDYVIAHAGGEKSNIWLWVSEGIEKTDELAEEMAKYIIQNPKAHICTNAREDGSPFLEEIADKIGMVCRLVMPMNVYACYRLNDALTKKGHILSPISCETHKKRIAIMYKQMNEAIGKVISEKGAEEFAERAILAKTLFLWEDQDIVSMAQIAHEKVYARINDVVTDMPFRGNGYAAMLLHDMCQLILDRDSTPMLYADARNPFSNRMYLKVGFELQGKISEFQLTERI